MLYILLPRDATQSAVLMRQHVRAMSSVRPSVCLSVRTWRLGTLIT